MSRLLLVAIAVVLFLLAVIGVRFYSNNLTGALTSVKPVGNIAEVFQTPSSFNPVTNDTEFPLKLPSGFQLSLFSQNLGGARVMAQDQTGTLLVSIPSEGKIVALPDKNNDGVSDENITVVSGLNRPHGMAFRCQGICELYVAENDKVSVFDYNSQTKIASNKRKILDLPKDGGHWTRTIIFHENKLYISIGSSCNVCIESDRRRSTIYVSNVDGSDFKEFASGLRNSVFMAVHPQTNEIWATEMGRDLLGDNTPSEEVNIIKEGQNYGWPYCYEDRVHDTKFDSSSDKATFCATTQKPHIRMQAHSAPLGLAFIPPSWPKEYENDLLVAYHGSWNRSVPTGYKIVRMKLDKNGKFEGEEDFLSGWLNGREALGRPVDILLTKEAGFISDDKAGVIYLLQYK